VLRQPNSQHSRLDPRPDRQKAPLVGHSAGQRGRPEQRMLMPRDLLATAGPGAEEQPSGTRDPPLAKPKNLRGHTPLGCTRTPNKHDDVAEPLARKGFGGGPLAAAEEPVQDEASTRRHIGQRLSRRGRRLHARGPLSQRQAHTALKSLCRSATEVQEGQEEEALDRSASSGRGPPIAQIA
ncbi:unnamed protein product, partial [Prorocentrum cordatum]